MFDGIGRIWKAFRAQQQRRANIRVFSGLSDAALRDIGVERGEIETMFDETPRIARSWELATPGIRTQAEPCG